MLLGRVALALVDEDVKVLTDALAGLGRLNHIVNEAAGRRRERVAERRLVLGLLCAGPSLVGLLGVLEDIWDMENERRPH